MTTKTTTVPLINPKEHNRIANMFRDSVDRHERDIVRMEVLIEQLDESDSLKDLTCSEADLVAEALRKLITEREESIRTLEDGIVDLRTR